MRFFPLEKGTLFLAGIFRIFQGSLDLSLKETP
jgi:hypothetical protein